MFFWLENFVSLSFFIGQPACHSPLPCIPSPWAFPGGPPSLIPSPGAFLGVSPSLIPSKGRFQGSPLPYLFSSSGAFPGGPPPLSLLQKRLRGTTSLSLLQGRFQRVTLLLYHLCRGVYRDNPPSIPSQGAFLRGHHPLYPLTRGEPRGPPSHIPSPEAFPGGPPILSFLQGRIQGLTPILYHLCRGVYMANTLMGVSMGSPTLYTLSRGVSRG